MASNLVNLIASAFGTTAKPTLPAPAKAAPTDDQFARMVDAQAAPRNETPTAETPASPEDKVTDKPAENAAPDATSETAAAAETPPAEDKDDKTEAGGTSLADALLAALSALGVNTEAITGEKGELDLTDPAALNDIKDALNELAQSLGLDVTALMGQLAQLAKDVPATGGVAGSTDLTAKLTAWLGERLGTPGAALPPDVETSLNKLVAGLEQLTKPVPTQPNLGTAELKLPEPVLTAPAAAPAETAKTEIAEPELKVEADALQHTGRKKDAEPADAGQKAQANGQAARPNGNQDNTLNLAPAAQAQQADAAPTQVDSSAAAPRVVQTGYQTSQQQLNLPQLAFEMSRQVQDGNTRFQIRLDPPELGRIDVKLEIDNRGQVHAKLTVEKAETLDLMQRDQRALERALQQSGLDQSKTSLEFSLKQNPFAGDQNGRSGNGQGGQGGGQAETDEIEAPAPAITLYRGALQASGVNIIA